MEHDDLGYADFLELEWEPRESNGTRDVAREVDPAALAHAQSVDAQVFRLA